MRNDISYIYIYIYISIFGIKITHLLQVLLTIYAVSGSALYKEQKESQGICLFIMHCTTPERVMIFFGIPLVNFLSPESLGY